MWWRRRNPTAASTDAPSKSKRVDQGPRREVVERATAHLRIGRLLASLTPPEELEDNIFDIVNQFERGAALIDVISPCVAFNNHPGSTKSYDYVRAHNMASENKLDFVEPKDEITVDYAVGSSVEIPMHDGSRLMLHKLDGHDPRDSDAAIMAIRTNAAKGEVATGLLYINESQQDMHDILATDARPLNALPMAELCPGSKALDAINARLR